MLRYWEIIYDVFGGGGGGARGIRYWEQNYIFVDVGVFDQWVWIVDSLYMIEIGKLSVCSGF